jgi:MazG family protein
LANEDTPPIQGLVATIAALREHCPWMGALTHESLVEYLLEEAHEVAETIEAGGGDPDLQAELGDVLLQVVLHARLAQERSAFDLDDVARGLTAKMVRRNPHVFRPDGSLQDSFPATVEEIVRKWDAVKRSERLLHTDRPHPADALDGVPAALPALARAQKLLDRAERAGLAPAVGAIAAGPAAAAAEPSGTSAAGPAAVVVPDSEAELGELLFGIAAAARAKGLDAERALRGAARRFQDSHALPPTP